MTLKELISAIDERLDGRACTMSWIDRADGSQVGAAKADGNLIATWRAELVYVPVFDGETPRGPKDYQPKFFDRPSGKN